MYPNEKSYLFMACFWFIQDKYLAKSTAKRKRVAGPLKYNLANLMLNLVFLFVFRQYLVAF